jgi:hypothetical protein
MAIRVGTTPILKMYAGPEAGPTPPPSSGLIGWFDASDYTSGATWVDRSTNGLDLTLSGTYALDASTLGGPSINFSNGWGGSPSTSLINGGAGTAYTHIEILRVATPSNFDSSFSLSAGGTGDDCNSLTGFQLSGTGWIAVGKNCSGGRQYYITSKQYNNTDTYFVSRRFEHGGTPGSGLLGDVGTTSSGLTQYGTGGWTAWAGITSVDYALGSAGKMAVASVNGGNYKMPGYYAVNLFYDRFLTDVEVQTIYDYYKTTYSLA